MNTSKKEYRYNIVSTTNPITIKLPVDSTSAVLGTRTKKTLEIESFNWLGTFSKVAQGTGAASDVDNVPPLFFSIRIDEALAGVSGMVKEDNSAQKILEFATPKTQLDSIPTVSPMIVREGGNTMSDYGGISYDYTKVIYSVDTPLSEKVDISKVSGTDLVIKIYSEYTYIDGSNNTLTNNGIFKFAARPIQGLSAVSEPYILRVLIVDE